MRIRSCLLLFLATTPLLATYTPIFKGTGAPSSALCDASTEVGSIYLRSDNPATNPSIAYVCVQTGAATFAWSQIGLLSGTTTPAKCDIGQLFFDTDATAGSNLFGCTAADTWTALGGAGGGLGDPGGNGVVVRTALNTTINRTITGTTNRIAITNGDGVSANPIIDLATDPSLSSGALTTTIANDGTTGTTVKLLAKLTGAPSTAIRSDVTDTGGAVGVVVSGAGTTGSAEIAIRGQVICTADNATTAGNYVIIGTSTNGRCRDGGSTFPVSGQILGRWLTTTSVGNDGTVLLFGPEMPGKPNLGSLGPDGIGAFNNGDDTTAARTDHTHRTLLALTWFFPGEVVSGTQTARALVVEGGTNCTINNSRISVNTTSGSSSTYNIARCTTAAGDCGATSNIYSSAVTLNASTQSVAGGTPTTPTVAAGDAFKVILTPGSGLADVTITMTYRCEIVP